MPLAGFACPPWVPTAGQQNAIAHCLGSCPHPCASPLLLNAVWRANHANHHKGAYISASLFAGNACARQTTYERFYDFYEQPTRTWWPFRGTVVHTVIEHAGLEDMLQYGWLQELRMAVPLTYPDVPSPVLTEDGTFTGEFSDEPLTVTLGGTTDAYNVRTRELHDFKSMADEKVEMFAKAGKVEKKWEIQLNVYRWLVSQTPTPSYVKAAFGDTVGEFLPPPEKLVIQGIGMMNFPRTGSAIGLKVREDGSRYKRYAEYTIEDVRVWSLDETEAFVRTEAIKWYRYFLLRHEAPIVDEENRWLCKGCAFNGEVVQGGVCFPTREARAEQTGTRTRGAK